MNVRPARPGEDATTVRDYLEQAAAASGTHGGDLILEVGRWLELLGDGQRDTDEAVALYSARYRAHEEEVRVRLEGFRQVTGVLPARFVELAASHGPRPKLRALLDLEIVGEPDSPSPDPPVAV